MTSNIIHKSDIVSRLGKKLNNIPLDDVNSGVNLILKCMRQALCNNRIIAIRGLGTFRLHHYPERALYHPQKETQERLEARKVPRFKAGQVLSSKLSKQSTDP